MTSNTIMRNAAVVTQLQTVPVSELKLGMVVHAIAKQSGKLGVKNKGAIRHFGIIEQLKLSGVCSVVIESASAPTQKSASKKRVTDSQELFAADSIQSSAKQGATNIVADNDRLTFTSATNLLNTSEAIYKKFTQSLAQNHDVDFEESRALTENIYSNLVEHPEALLCLSMIMQSDNYLAKHSIHVATLICYFAHYLGYPKQECEKLALMGYLYDVGMAKVPQAIRHKKGTLTNEDKQEIKLHVAYSLHLLSPLKLESEYVLAIEQHHERLDGSGYPYGYLGTKIHKFSRMLAIVDTYDALTTARKYKAALSPTAAMNELSNPDLGYDQKLVLKFIRCMGVYPVGSLVVLSNQRLGLVIKTNAGAPISPVVRVFYSIKGKHFVQPVEVDLAALLGQNDEGLIPQAYESKHDSSTIGCDNKPLRVLKPVLASQFGLDMTQIL